MDEHSTGYIAFAPARDNEVLGRVIVTSFNYQCPRCGQLVYAHEGHGEKECPEWDKRDAFLPLQGDAIDNQ